MAHPVPLRRKLVIGPGPMHPFHLRQRIRGPGRTRIGAIFEVPRGGYLFELRVSAWFHTRPAEPHDRYLAPFSEDKLRLARRLALQLRIPWSEPPGGPGAPAVNPGAVAAGGTGRRAARDQNLAAPG
jgi:hypothetical protein